MANQKKGKRAVAVTEEGQPLTVNEILPFVNPEGRVHIDLALERYHKAAILASFHEARQAYAELEKKSEEQQTVIDSLTAAQLAASAPEPPALPGDPPKEPPSDSS